jgi:EAL domain-containing protein (putative c-di-GMP-specific phosphodiesterase class I)/GGDEF domain-containing protein
MSLIKQLWLAILFSVTIASTGSFILSTIYSKNYLQTELQTRNIDNVSSLALSMSQIKKDTVTLDLLLSAQFDSGHYRYIGLFDPNGKMITERVNENSQTKAPRWFTKLFHMNVNAGLANVQDGWKQYGSLTLESDVNFAYDSLWNVTLLTAIWMFLIALTACYVGGKVLRKILSPLDDVVNQAKAIGENRFITIKEPSTTEFKQIVSEMNQLSNHIKENVTKESLRLDDLRQLNHYDDVTGLMNHDYFVSTMEATLSHDEYNDGALVILRLANLGQINERIGYAQTNLLLKSICNDLNAICAEDTSLIAGRISGTEFAVFCNKPCDEFVLANTIRETVIQHASTEYADLTARFLVITTKAKKMDETSSLFKVLEFILNLSSLSEENYQRVLNATSISSTQGNYLVEWKASLESAIHQKRIKLAHYPVIKADGSLLHLESPVRLQLEENGEWHCAGDFIHWATELNLIKAIDVEVLEMAINQLNQGASPLCLNVSATAMCDRKFVQKAARLIKQRLTQPKMLSLEVNESAAFDHLDAFKYFSSKLIAVGTHVGIEHVAMRIARLGELHDVGLSYIKFDASIVRGIESNKTNTALLRGLCMIAHSIGLQAIAEGVHNEAEVKALKEIGIDGLTGPGVTSQNPLD